MRKNIYKTILLFISAWSLSTSTLFAANNVSLRSSYLGDGLFKYEMTVYRDPFFIEEKNNIAILDFTNLVEVVEHSPNWRFLDHTNAISLEYPEGYADIERPYSAYCIVKSSYTNYCLVPAEKMGAVVHGSLLHLDDMFGNPYGSANVVFYTTMAAIVPCSEEKADSSLPVCEYNVELIPDLKINNLITENGHPKGLSISWDSDCTVLVQASTDFTDWIDIGYSLGSPPATNWIPATPLENYGKFYRVLLVANGHHPELLSGTELTTVVSTEQTEKETPTPFKLQGFEKGRITLLIDTTRGAKYAVSIKHNRTSEIFKSLAFIATEEHTTIDLETPGIPTAASIEVTEIR